VSSLVSLFLDHVADEPDRPALHVKRSGSFAAVTWTELAGDARRLAAALRRLGVAPGDRVVQVSENRYEWIVTDLAVLMARGVHVAIHSTLSGPQIAYQINDCEPRVIVISTQSQADNLAAQELPTVSAILSHEECSWPSGCGHPPIRRWVEADTEVRDDEAKSIESEAAKQLTPDDLATILYTSGTTGEPKGVMLTHGNLRTNAEATLATFGSQSGDVVLNWLPLSHIYARTCDYYTVIAARQMALALAESRDTIIADCQTVRPTFINGVPYFYDKIARHIRDSGQTEKPGAIRDLLGGRMRLCCAGGAALPDHVAEFFNRQGMRLLQGYGLTESSPVISFSTDPTKVGSVGPPIPGIEVRIAPDGEILTRGPHVMRGYWRKPEETAKTVEDGWLHTGDLGRLDADGFLYITGRKKELIVTASGKNIAPVLIESLLTEDPLIQQAMVVGDGRNYLAALIVVHQANLDQLVGHVSNVPGTLKACPTITDAQIRAIFAQRITDRLNGLSRHEQIGRFTLLAQPFTVDREELTPTLKLRRNVIAEHYSAEIEAMYAKGS
jgi:long-chain acyl-CoA synthetase